MTQYKRIGIDTSKTVFRSHHIDDPRTGQRRVSGSLDCFRGLVRAIGKDAMP